MADNIETVRSSWGMKLDSARNHIILLNLKMTLASLCIMVATVGGWFRVPERLWRPRNTSCVIAHKA
jgi:hypothetical protein